MKKIEQAIYKLKIEYSKKTEESKPAEQVNKIEAKKDEKNNHGKEKPMAITKLLATAEFFPTTKPMATIIPIPKSRAKSEPARTSKGTKQWKFTESSKQTVLQLQKNGSRSSKLLVFRSRRREKTYTK